MKTSINFPLYQGCLAEYGTFDDLLSACRVLGCDGIEVIWGDTPCEPLPDRVLGYHLTFWPDWLDFWLGDEAALLRKFGTRAALESHYGGSGREDMLAQYRQDLARAEQLGAEYVVFHVSDVSIEEGYTYRWLHTDEEVIDAACELINELTADRPQSFAFLVENQWWPGFTFTNPALTARLLDGIRYENKGILLDTGHLLNTNPALRTEAEAVAYIHAMLDAHGDLAQFIRGMHLHCSLSGEYVQAHTGLLPPLPADYTERFIQSYGHILQIDRHRPWTDPAIASVVERIHPQFLTHELSAGNRPEKETAVRTQIETLRRGGLTL